MHFFDVIGDRRYNYVTMKSENIIFTNFCRFWRISSLIRSISIMSNFNHELTKLSYFHLLAINLQIYHDLFTS